jgi:hypothetical protein
MTLTLVKDFNPDDTSFSPYSSVFITSDLQFKIKISRHYFSIIGGLE